MKYVHDIHSTLENTERQSRETGNICTTDTRRQTK